AIATQRREREIAPRRCLGEALLTRAERLNELDDRLRGDRIVAALGGRGDGLAKRRLGRVIVVVAAEEESELVQRFGLERLVAEGVRFACHRFGGGQPVDPSTRDG